MGNGGIVVEHHKLGVGKAVRVVQDLKRRAAQGGVPGRLGLERVELGDVFERGVDAVQVIRRGQIAYLTERLDAIGDVVVVDPVATLLGAQAQRHLHTREHELVDGIQPFLPLVRGQRGCELAQHVFQAAAIPVPCVFHFLVACLGARLVVKVARNRAIKRCLAEIKRVRPEHFCRMRECPERMLGRGEVQPVEHFAARQVDLRKDVVRQDQRQQLGVIVLLDQVIVVLAVEGRDVLPGRQVVDEPGREDDAHGRIALKDLEVLVDLDEDGQVVVGVVEHVFALRAAVELVQVFGRTQVGRAPEIPDVQLVLIFGDHLFGGVA